MCVQAISHIRVLGTALGAAHGRVRNVALVELVPGGAGRFRLSTARTHATGLRGRAFPGSASRRVRRRARQTEDRISSPLVRAVRLRRSPYSDGRREVDRISARAVGRESRLFGSDARGSVLMAFRKTGSSGPPVTSGVVTRGRIAQALSGREGFVGIPIRFRLLLLSRVCRGENFPLPGLASRVRYFAAAFAVANASPRETAPPSDVRLRGRRSIAQLATRDSRLARSTTRLAGVGRGKRQWDFSDGNGHGGFSSSGSNQ
jgi:hypothetical protein